MISTFDWTSDATQRIFRVPAGFMRNKTQERIEELARERAAASIDLALVEDGIEFGKRMMAEMIATYPSGHEPRPRRRRRSDGHQSAGPGAHGRRSPQRERLSQRSELAVGQASGRSALGDAPPGPRAADSLSEVRSMGAR